MKKIKELFIKYKEIITYLIFGVLTTLLNWAVYWVALRFFGMFIHTNAVNVAISNIIAWVLAVIFAYVTNKLWVFESKSWSKDVIVKEIIEFVTARGITGVLEEVSLVLVAMVKSIAEFSFVLWKFNISGNMIVKIIVSIIVMILNYVFSKFIVFKKKHHKEKDNKED